MTDRAWPVEHRYRAVLEVRDSSPVTEVASRYGVSRQAIYAWRDRYERDGIAGLEEASRRPRAGFRPVEIQPTADAGPGPPQCVVVTAERV